MCFFFSDVLSLELSQQGFLYVNDDGFGEMTELILTRVFKPDVIPGWLLPLPGRKLQKGVNGSRLARWCGPSAAIVLLNHVELFGHVDSASLMDNHRLNVTYRWNAFRPWLFFSVTCRKFRST